MYASNPISTYARRTEVTVLHDLFHAQTAISFYNFMDATLTLYKCKTELDKWKKIYTELAGGESMLN